MVLFQRKKIQTTSQFSRLRTNLLFVSGVGEILRVIDGPPVVAMLIEGCMWMGNHFVVLRRVLWFEQFLQSDDAWQQQGQFTNDQSLEGDQSEETEHKWQKGGSLQLEQQQQWQQ